MSNWRVWRDPWDVWCVQEKGARDDDFAWFRTWCEAMDYADRMARTVEVVLPRVHALPTGRHTVHRNGLIVEYVRSRSQPQLPPSCVVVEPEERRPLALALLALAEREETE